jgi:hypothetical protein
MLKKCSLLLLAIVLIMQLGLVGCGNNEKKMKTKAYANDGLLGTTGGYPNFPTNPSFHTYARDKSLVMQALKPIKGIRNSQILFRGPDLTVNLDLEPATDIETAMDIKYAALGSVSLMMPRYRVKVNVGKNMLPHSG